MTNSETIKSPQEKRCPKCGGEILKVFSPPDKWEIFCLMCGYGLNEE